MLLIASLIVRHIHSVQLMHVAGSKHTLSQFLQRFWMSGAPRFIATLIQQCVQCRRRKIRRITAPEGMLPEFRVPKPDEPRVMPFASLAIDAAGPFQLKFRRTRNSNDSMAKRWLLIFICTTYKAIHIEILHTMDTASLLMAFTRFTSRRGIPSRVLSDNGGQEPLTK